MALTYANPSEIAAGDIARANSIASFNAQQAVKSEPNAYGLGVGMRELAGSPLSLSGSPMSFSNADLGRNIPNTIAPIMPRIPIASGVAGPGIMGSVPQQIGAVHVEQQQAGAITPPSKPSSSPPLTKVVSAPAPAPPSVQTMINNPTSEPALTPWQSMNGSFGTWKRLMTSNFYNGPLAQRTNQQFFGTGGY